jgi:hypothetical protein
MAASIYLYMDLWERNNEMPTIPEVAAGIMRPFLTNILYSIIMSLLVLAACLPLILFVMAVGDSPGMMALLIFILFFGILFFSAFFVLVYPANTIGRNEFGSPIRAVWILLKDNWWSSLGYLLVLILIYYVFSMITQLATSLLFGASTLLNPESIPASGKSMTLVYGFNILLQQVFYIIVFVGTGILYYTLHEEKVGSGLESRIDELGSQKFGQGQEEEY